METIKADHNPKEKAFDAVKIMRETRDKISSETQNMSLTELQGYIQKKTKEGNVRQIGK